MTHVPTQPGDDSETIPEYVEFLVMQEPDGGFAAWATCAPIFTQADTWDELREMAREAVLCHYGDDAHPVIHLRRDAAFADG